MTTKRELLEAEDAGWSQLCGLLSSLEQPKVEQVGYTPDWSVKDLMAHIGGWAAETVQILEQVRNDTFHPFKVDVDQWNERFVEANRDQPPSVVKSEMTAARNRMLDEFNRLPELTPVAEEWFRESGPAHYDEHLARLEEWVGELR